MGPHVKPNISYDFWSYENKLKGAVNFGLNDTKIWENDPKGMSVIEIDGLSVNKYEDNVKDVKQCHLYKVLETKDGNR